MYKKFSYLDYLKKRGRLGFWYRKYWLYPKLNNFVSGKALDIGCGIGDFIEFRVNTVGVDIDFEIVSWCVSKGFPVSLMRPDVLDFPDKAFDSIVLDNVLEHLGNPEKLLAEIKRVLVPGGIVLIGVPGVKGYDSDSDHKVYYDQRSLIDTLNLAGFSNEKLFHMPIPLPILSNIMSQYCIYGVFRS